MAQKVGVDYVFMVIGPWCWGKGKTETEAYRKACKEGGKRKLESYNVYLVPPTAVVTQMGGIEWKLEDGKPDNAIFVKQVQGKLAIAASDVEDK